METRDFLRMVEPFRGLSDAPIRALVEHCVTHEFDAGERIIARGAAGDSMYVIRSGKVRVVVRDDDGQEKFVTRLGLGECFGEMALLTGEPRMADVFAESSVECLVIKKAPLESFLREQPSVAAFLTEILGKRLLESGHLRRVGKYQLVGELGRGGIAIVYEGIHPELERTVAIKMLSHALVYDQEFASRFRNEAKIIAGLEHDNIVRVYDCEEAYATYFIIMEKLGGIDLTKMREAQGTFSEELTTQVILQLASALDYAHRHGIIHRDIKPENVIIDSRQCVKLMDFGIAKTRSEEENSEEIIGTAEYMSPEQALGKPIDGRTDIYSLGIMVYEMLTGGLPFDSPDPYEIIRRHVTDYMPKLDKMLPGVSPLLASFVDLACKKDPEDRFKDCAAVIEHFGGLPEGKRAPISVKSIAIFHDPGLDGSVSRLLAEITERATALPGVKVKVSDLGQV